MALLTIRINGYNYRVGCEDGQEPHLLAMADQVEQRIGSIRALGSQSGEAQLLVLASLLLADELHDTKAALAAAKGEPPPQSDAPDQAWLHERLLTLAENAEAIAEGLEKN